MAGKALFYRAGKSLVWGAKENLISDILHQKKKILEAEGGAFALSFRGARCPP